MTYDRADWHYGGDFPEGFLPKQGATHIGIFLAWAILNHLEGEQPIQNSKNALLQVRERKITGTDFLMTECDEKLWDEDLNEEGNAFAQYYYANDETGYSEDYLTILAEDLPSIYHVEDSWENYDKLAPVIDERFRKWKAERIKKV